MTTWSDTYAGNTRKNQVTRLVTLRHRSTMSGALNLASTLTLLLQFGQARYRVVAEARQAFEPLMAQLAAARIEPKELAELEQTVIDMETDIGDRDAYLFNQPAFSSGAAQGIEYPVRRRTAVLAVHRRIYDTIRAGDSEQAAEAMCVHVAEYVTYAERKFPAALDKLIKW
jgi:GntR family transcriptional regulator, transcriptional repressor for pyruvate dehydrogenase complex